jgi:RNA polymerase sigma-70 factor (ECF subfamily)
MEAIAKAPQSAGAAALPFDHVRFERLFADHYRWVWCFLRRLGVPEGVVDDAAQHVFLVASDRLEQIELAKERGFLAGVAARTAANARRLHARRREDPQSETDSGPANGRDPEALLDWKQRRERLDAWLAVLELELRAPFVLFELDGLSLNEIAELLGVPLGTVKTRLRRARALFLEAAHQGGTP